ncbi:MAG TPA: hypothetical protein ENJ45_02355, partial [Phaeodactylibacter sp.]|nr:hypothetical protein [Phaeodactylibacter sp.]
MISIFTISVFAQKADTISTKENTLSALEQKVMHWGDILLKDSLLENRKAAAEQLFKSLTTALQAEGSFAYPFDSVQTLSIQYPSDSTFRIFTWQLYVDKDRY